MKNLFLTLIVALSLLSCSEDDVVPFNGEIKVEYRDIEYIFQGWNPATNDGVQLVQVSAGYTLAGHNSDAPSRFIVWPDGYAELIVAGKTIFAYRDAKIVIIGGIVDKKATGYVSHPYFEAQFRGVNFAKVQ